MDILLSIDAYPVHVSAEYRLCTIAHMISTFCWHWKCR